MLALMLIVPMSSPVCAETAESGEVCDIEADYFLGIENYAEAIRAHLEVVRKNPRDSLAHYHLGFAYGMIGRHEREREEYLEALSFGRIEWSLLLNLGLSYFDQGEYAAATEILTVAAIAGPRRPETHYNLALAYERRAMLAQAEQELLLSLVLDPAQPEARNMLALVHEEQGDRSRARREWADLARAYPDFKAARSNLAILDSADPDASSTVIVPSHANRSRNGAIADVDTRSRPQAR